MKGELKQLLNLPEARSNGASKLAPHFGDKFRQQMDGLNQKVRLLAASGNRSDYRSLDAKRSKLYDAYQMLASQIDPANPAKSEGGIQKVIAAVSTVECKASDLAGAATRDAEAWAQREAYFDDAMAQIGELEDTQYPKAPTYRKVGDSIRNLVNSRAYADAVEVFDRLHPKLQQIVTEQAAGDTRGGETPIVEKPGGHSGVDKQASCQITINNKTEWTLALIAQRHERGDFMSLPDTTISPGGSIGCVSVETPEADDDGCKGFLEWEVEGCGVTWRVEWDNPEQKKNTTTSTLAGQGAQGFHGLDQIGQGDENVPTVFTLSGAAAAGEIPETTFEVPPGDAHETPRETPPAATDSPREGLTVVVVNAERGDAVEGASVAVGDQADATSGLGLATVELPVGDHSYEATADGYKSASGQVTIVEGDNPELVIELTAVGGDAAREGFTMLVRNAENSEPIENAAVTAGDQSDTTSNRGLATFELPVGDHDYEVKSDGFDSASGHVTIVEGDRAELLVELTIKAHEEKPDHEDSPSDGSSEGSETGGPASGVSGVNIDRDVQRALTFDRQFSESQDNVERARLATELIEIYERLQALLAQAPIDAEGRPVLTGEVRWNPDPDAPLSGTLEDITPFGAIDAWRVALRRQGVQGVHQPVKPLTIERVFTFTAETSTLASDITGWIDDHTDDGHAVELVEESNLQEVLRSLAESADEGERVLFRAFLSGGEWHHDSVTFRAFRLTPPPPGNFPPTPAPEERARIIRERKRQILRGQLDFSAPPPAQGDDRLPTGASVSDQMEGYRRAWELYLHSGNSEGTPYRDPAQRHLELGRQRAVREIHALMRQPAWVIQAIGAARDELIRLMKRQEERVGRVYSGEDPKPGPKKTAPAKAKQTGEPTKPAGKVKSKKGVQK